MKPKSKLKISREEKIYADHPRKKFAFIEDEFTELEKKFIIENLNRRSDLNLDLRDLQSISIDFIQDFLRKIEPEMISSIGSIVIQIIRSKFKSYNQPQNQKENHEKE